MAIRLVEHPSYRSMLLGEKVYIKFQVVEGNPFLKKKTLWGFTSCDEEGRIHVEGVVQTWHDNPHHDYLFYALNKRRVVIGDKWRLTVEVIRKEDYALESLRQEKFWMVMNEFLDDEHRYQELHFECQRLWLEKCGLDLETENRITMRLHQLEQQMNDMVMYELAQLNF